MELCVKRTTSTSPTFVKLKDLPSPLREAVECHRALLRQECAARKDGTCWAGCLHDKEGSEGMCLEASGDFTGTLKAFKIGPGRGKSFIREFIFHPMDRFEKRRQREDKHLSTFPFDSSGYRFHFVVKVGEFIIDWTARQFGAKNPFPAIWREP